MVLVDDSLKPLSPRFDRRTNSNNWKLMQLVNKPIEGYLQELKQLSDMRDIDQATGKYLDHIGQLVGEYRGANDDEFYRMMIKARNSRRHQDGTINQLYKVVSDTLECKPSEFRIVPLWNVTGEANAIRILNVPFNAIDDQSKVKILIQRLQEAASANCRIDSLTFKDVTNAHVYVATFTRMDVRLTSKEVDSGNG